MPRSIRLAQCVEGEPAPGRVRAFDDEGRAVGREFIGVGPDPPRLGLFEGEGEGVECLGCTEPGEAVGAGFGIDPEPVRIMVAKAAVDAVGADDEFVIGPMLQAGLALLLEVELDAELAGALAKDREQALAADADEAVADERTVSPRIWTSMSSQWANSSAMICADGGSLAARFSTVWSLNTTPQPKVSPSRLRSKTWMLCDASRNFIEIAK